MKATHALAIVEGSNVRGSYEVTLKGEILVGEDTVQLIGFPGNPDQQIVVVPVGDYTNDDIINNFAEVQYYYVHPEVDAGDIFPHNSISELTGDDLGEDFKVFTQKLDNKTK